MFLDYVLLRHRVKDNLGCMMHKSAIAVFDRLYSCSLEAKQV